MRRKVPSLLLILFSITACDSPLAPGPSPGPNRSPTSLGREARTAVSGAYRARGPSPLEDGFRLLSSPRTPVRFPSRSRGFSDDEVARIPIGFSFAFYGVAYEELNVETNGRLVFGDLGHPGMRNEPGYQPYYPAATPMKIPFADPLAGYNPANCLMPWWEDTLVRTAGEDHRGSEVSFALLGDAPSRALVIEFRELERYPAASGEHLTYQVRLFEEDASIEFAYGENTETWGAAAVGIQGLPPGGAPDGVRGLDCTPAADSEYPDFCGPQGDEVTARWPAGHLIRFEPI